jgi:hypothetical protein
MTLNVLRGRVRGPRSAPEPFAIGEIDADIFNCPACARPLGVGATRCLGCGTFLVMGVQARRATFLIALGMAFGILGGGLITASMLNANRAAEVTAAVDAALGTRPVAVGNAAPAPIATLVPAPVAAPPVPAGLSAIRQTAIIDARLANASTLLTTHLVAASFDTGEVAKILRSIAGDATVGTDLAGRVATWGEASEVAAQLRALYDDAIATARGGLDTPLRDTASYRLAVERVVESLAGLPALDAAARELARRAGLPIAISTTP